MNILNKKFLIHFLEKVNNLWYKTFYEDSNPPTIMLSKFFNMVMIKFQEIKKNKSNKIFDFLKSFNSHGILTIYFQTERTQ